MNDQDPSASTENRLSGAESSPATRRFSPDIPKARGDGLVRREQPRPSTTEPKQLKIVVRIAPAEAQPSEAPKPAAEVTAPPVLNPPPSQDASLETSAPPEISARKLRAEAEPQQIPARMLNEFV